MLARLFPALTQIKWTGIKRSCLWALMGFKAPFLLSMQWLRCLCACVCVCTYMCTLCVLMNAGTHTGSRAPRLPPDQLCCTRSACTRGERKREAESTDCAEEMNALNYKNFNAAANAAHDKSPVGTKLSSRSREPQAAYIARLEHL